MKLSENPVFHDKSKHIEIKYHYIRDMVQRGVVKLQYVATDELIADVLTKPLARVKFDYFREKLGVLQIKVPSKGMSHPRFRPRMHDVYNVINHGEELKVKAPPSIWLCMFGNGDICRWFVVLSGTL